MNITEEVYGVWQPIETAPKDGRQIILHYLNSSRLSRTVMGCWLTDEAAEDIDGQGYGLNAGWYELIDNWDDYSHVAIYAHPTHWIPLPAPPEGV